MERIANNIADYIASELNYDNDKRDVIAYGAFALLQTLLSIALVVIFGLAFHLVTEVLILSFSASILRKYSGGAHASSPGICTLMSIIFPLVQAFLISLFMKSSVGLGSVIFLGFLIFIWGYYTIVKLAPVDSPSKPIKKEEKRKRMKKGSIVILSIYLLSAILCMYLYFFMNDKIFVVYTLCIYFGIVWQVFTLTNIGHKFIHIIDKFLIYIAHKLRR